MQRYNPDKNYLNDKSSFKGKCSGNPEFSRNASKVWLKIVLIRSQLEREWERTLLMLWTKLLLDVPEALPIEFISLPAINNNKGTDMPSPMAPIKPKTMKNQSRTSACMKMDLKEPFFFFFLTMETFFWSPPPIWLVLHFLFLEKQPSKMFLTTIH